MTEDTATMAEDTAPTAEQASSQSQFDMDVAAGGQGFLGQYQYFFERGFLPPTPVEEPEFALFQDGLYVEPDATENWSVLPEYLADNGVLVLKAPPGTGRRTTALWLLRTVLGAERQFVDLETDWPKPEVRLLPQLTKHGCILDMSSPSDKEPDDRFGQALAAYGEQVRGNDQLLVVLTTPDVWKGRWTEGARPFTVDLSAPDGRELVRRRLDGKRRDDLVKLLDGTHLTEVWKHKPRALDAGNLADHLLRLGDSDDLSSEIAALSNQFTGWRSRIEELLAPKNDFDGIQHGQAIARSIVWSGALHEGCRPRSVIQGSDRFLEAAGVERSDADVFTEPSALHKLDLAGVEEENGLARFKERPEALDKAVLNHLWSGYSSRRLTLRRWIKDILQSGELSGDETRLVAQRVVDLAVAHSDRALFQTLRESLIDEYRPLAVEVLTSAALASSSGTYMRGQLYNWAKNQSDTDTLALVADMCGGELGVHKPKVALTRLRLVAANAPFGFEPLRDALAKVLARHADVTEPLREWLEKPDNDRARLGTLLALAHSGPGSRVLLGESAERLAEGSHKNSLSGSLRFLISHKESGLSTHHALERWGEQVKAGHFGDFGDEVTGLLVDAYSGPILHSVSREYKYEDPYWRDLWERAVDRSLGRPEPSVRT